MYEPYQKGSKKKFFQHIKSLCGDFKEIPVLEKDGKVYSIDFSKANVLNEYFIQCLSKMMILYYQTWETSFIQTCLLLK